MSNPDSFNKTMDRYGSNVPSAFKGSFASDAQRIKEEEEKKRKQEQQRVIDKKKVLLNASTQPTLNLNSPTRPPAQGQRTEVDGVNVPDSVISQDNRPAPSGDNFFKKVARALLPKSMESKSPIDLRGEPTETERLLSNENDRQSYLRNNRMHENFKELGVTQDMIDNPDKYMPEGYEEPTGFWGSVREGFSYGYAASIKSMPGNLQESSGHDLSLGPEAIEKGEKAADKAAAYLLKNPHLYQANDTKGFIEQMKSRDFDIRYYGRTVGETIPFVAAILGTAATTFAATRNPVITAKATWLATFSLEKANSYRGMIESGVAPSKAADGSTVYATIAASLEQGLGYNPSSVVIASAAKQSTLNTVKRSGSKTLKKILGEGGEESSQAFFEQLTTAWLNDSQDINWGEVAESFPAGVIGSGPFIAVDAVGQMRKRVEGPDDLVMETEQPEEVQFVHPEQAQAQSEVVESNEQALEQPVDQVISETINVPEEFQPLVQEAQNAQSKQEFVEQYNEIINEDSGFKGTASDFYDQAIQLSSESEVTSQTKPTNVNLEKATQEARQYKTFDEFLQATQEGRVSEDIYKNFIDIEENAPTQTMATESKTPVASKDQNTPVDTSLSARIKRVNNRVKESSARLDETTAGKRRKGEAMELAGIKRAIEGKPTTIEYRNAEKRLNTHYSGRSVTVEGQKAETTGKVSFGKTEVKMPDGTTKFVERSKVKTTEPSRQDVFAYIKEQGEEKLATKESIYKTAESNSETETAFATRTFNRSRTGRKDDAVSGDENGKFAGSRPAPAFKTPSEVSIPEEIRKEAKRHKSAKEFVNAIKTKHRPPDMEGGSPLSDLTSNGSFPNDIYSPEAGRLYGNFGMTGEREAIRTIQSYRDKPNADVTIYRAVNQDERLIVSGGDWVTTSREYAQQHGESNLDSGFKIVSKKVKASEIFNDGNYVLEWGYRPDGHTDLTRSQLTDIWNEVNNEDSSSPSFRTTINQVTGAMEFDEPTIKRLRDFYNQAIETASPQVTPQPVEVKSPRVRPTPVPTEVQIQEGGTIEQKIAATEDALASLPLKDLEQYKIERSEGGFTLPESGVNVPDKYENMSKEKLKRTNKRMYYRRFGDDIVNELGYDTETVRPAFEEYMDLKNELRELKAERKELMDSVDTEFSPDQLDKINSAISQVVNSANVVIQDLVPVKSRGKVRTSRVGAKMQATAIEKGLIDEFNQLPEYNQVNLNEQAQRVQRLLTREPARAMRIAMGQELPPSNVLPEMVMIAVENQAVQNNDGATIQELSMSKLVLADTAMGQRIRALGERNVNSPIKIMALLKEAREARLKKKLKVKSLAKAKTKVKNQIKKNIKAPTKDDWKNFISNIQC